MKIYFTAAILYKEKLGKNYEKIVRILEKKGHQVIADHILKEEIPAILKETDEQRLEYYRGFLKRINSCDLLVAEASFPSTLHIGHEISIALEKGKPVIALYLKGKTPFFLEGIKSDKLFLVEYKLGELEKMLSNILEDAKEQMDVRFNFFISPKIGAYLDWIARRKKVPRAVYLRRLIEEDMKKSKEYKG